MANNSYWLKTGHLPAELSAIDGRIMKKIPAGPWGRLHEWPVGWMQIASLKRDGAPGGTDNDADLECVLDSEHGDVGSRSTTENPVKPFWLLQAGRT